MGIRRNLVRVIPAATLAAALAVGAVSAASAQDAAAFARYYGAIRAYELCNDTTFSQSEYEALTRAIDERTAVNLSIGETLTVIEEAQAEAWDTVFKNQCQGEPVRELLALFETDLAPALI